MDLRAHISALVLTLIASPLCSAQQVLVDPVFDATIAKAAYSQDGPTVMIDAAHFNYHTAQGRYRPLADLLRNDGYHVISGMTPLTSASLARTQVLVIANARGGDTPQAAGSSAFSAEECVAVRNWVRSGGALLLIADHRPFGSAAQPLADQFDLRMGGGYVSDRTQFDGDPSVLVFSRANGLLAGHPAVGAAQRVVTFQGQSLSVPEGAAALLRLGSGASEAIDPSQSQMRSVAGLAQGVALEFGTGRVVVLGEAAMLTAQILRQPGSADLRVGMNTPDNDDREFALGVMHWLSRHASSD